MKKEIIYKEIKIVYTYQKKAKTVKNIVLLHGFLENRTIWDSYCTALSKQYTVIAIDLLGHGETDCLSYIHTMEEMAEQVYHVLKQENIRKAYFVGHSMGGYVALALGELFPDCISGICLFNSSAKADSETKKVDRLRAVKVVKKNHELFIKEAINNLFVNKTESKIKLALPKMVQLALQTPKQGIVAALEGMRIRDNREVLLKFAPYPIHFILGTKDPILPIADMMEQVLLNPNNLYHVSEKGGHLCFIEDTYPCLTALKKMIKA